MDAAGLTDDELREQLIGYGVNVGPIVCKYFIYQFQYSAFKAL